MLNNNITVLNKNKFKPKFIAAVLQELPSQPANTINFEFVQKLLLQSIYFEKILVNKAMVSPVTRSNSSPISYATQSKNEL